MLFSLEKHTNVVRSAAFSPDERIVTGVGTIRSRSGTSPAKYPERSDGIKSVTFSPDGQRLPAPVMTGRQSFGTR
jgi:WD40 repeat protein